MRIIVLVLIAASLFTGCDALGLTDPEPSGDPISHGEWSSGRTYSVAPDGRTITLPIDDPAFGVSIEVPENAYSASRTFEVQYAEITESKVSDGLRTEGGIVRIRNGGGYATDVMKVTLPVSYAENEVPVAFFYDEANGTFELVPPIDLTDSSLTVGTRHLDGGALNGTFRAASGKGPSAQEVTGWINLLVLVGTTDVLKQTYTSTYVVGADDWEFPNYGTVLQPNGFCTGSMITSLDYYRRHRFLGLPTLHGRFDQVSGSKVWMDNPRGIRLASMTHQMNLGSGASFNAWLNALNPVGVSRDRIHYYAIAMGLKVGLDNNGGEPVLLAVFDTKNGGAHALIAYAASDGTINVADPNLPAMQASITYTDESGFQPYVSRLNVNTASQPFDEINAIGRSAMIDMGIADSLWSASERDDFGTGSNGFPGARFSVRTDPDESFAPLGEVVKASGKIDIRLDCDDCGAFGPQQRSAYPIILRVIDRSGNEQARLEFPAAGTVQTFTVPQDPGSFGYHVLGTVPVGQSATERFVDFRWVQHQEGEDDPDPPSESATIRVSGLTVKMNDGSTHEIFINESDASGFWNNRNDIYNCERVIRDEGGEKEIISGLFQLSDDGASIRYFTIQHLIQYDTTNQSRPLVAIFGDNLPITDNLPPSDGVINTRVAGEEVCNYLYVRDYENERVSRTNCAAGSVIELAIPAPK